MVNDGYACTVNLGANNMILYDITALASIKVTRKHEQEEELLKTSLYNDQWLS